MCESKVILLREDGTRETVMDEAAIIRVNGEYVEVRGLLGESVTLKGAISEIDLMEHEITVK